MKLNMKKLHDIPSFLTLGPPHDQNKKELCEGVLKNANFVNHNSSLKQNAGNTQKENN
jgi:hypothetical protein